MPSGAPYCVGTTCGLLLSVLRSEIDRAECSFGTQQDLFNGSEGVLGRRSFVDRFSDQNLAGFGDILTEFGCGIDFGAKDISITDAQHLIEA